MYMTYASLAIHSLSPTVGIMGSLRSMGELRCPRIVVVSGFLYRAGHISRSKKSNRSFTGETTTRIMVFTHRFPGGFPQLRRRWVTRTWTRATRVRCSDWIAKVMIGLWWFSIYLCWLCSLIPFFYCWWKITRTSKRWCVCTEDWPGYRGLSWFIRNNTGDSTIEIGIWPI